MTIAIGVFFHKVQLILPRPRFFPQLMLPSAILLNHLTCKIQIKPSTTIEKHERIGDILFMLSEIEQPENLLLLCLRANRLAPRANLDGNLDINNNYLSSAPVRENGHAKAGTYGLCSAKQGDDAVDLTHKVRSYPCDFVGPEAVKAR